MKLRKKINKNRTRILSLLIFVSILLGISINILIEFKKSDLSPDDSSAIYGGQIENNLYPFAGYLISYTTKQDANVCGITYLSDTVAVTAAHCVYNKAISYLGYSLFNFDIDQNFIAEDMFVYPGWDGKSVESDFAVVKVPKEFFPIEEFAQVGTPKKNCNYEILGYGKTEDEAGLTQLDKLRKKASVCIEEINNNTFVIRGQDGGVCFGDSGSPLFEKGTNKLVGVISSILASPEESNNPCSIANRASVVRMDRKASFVESVEMNSYKQEDLALCGEDCSNKRCSFGLICDDSKMCRSLSGSCNVNVNEYCSVAAGLNCEGNASCVLNKCKSESLVANYSAFLKDDLDLNLNPVVFEIRNYIQFREYVIYVIGGLVLLLVGVKVYEFGYSRVG